MGRVIEGVAPPILFYRSVIQYILTRIIVRFSTTNKMLTKEHMWLYIVEFVVLQI